MKINWNLVIKMAKKSVNCSKCGFQIDYYISHHPGAPAEEVIHQACPGCGFNFAVMFVRDNLPESTTNYSRRYS